MQALRQVSSQMILQGAYGRNYASKKDAIRDWEQGLDFKIQGGPYCSVRDLDTLINESGGVYIATQQGYVRVA